MPKSRVPQWTEQEIALLCELYPNMRTREVSERIGRPYLATRRKAGQLALRKTDDYMLRHPHEFQPGHKVPRERLTNPPKPIGTEIFRHGCVMRKVNLTGDHSADWKYVHRIVWEEAHGPIPPGYRVVFKNWNTTDSRLENLELVTAAENSRRAGQRYGAFPKELRQALFALGRLKTKIAEKS
ncbi:HNH endonuclease signature motif containing protein [Pseudomonas sp. CGJS7]|uniref:HNH endonuclease signature motif containing protein n=1 Tax=Pseudomonas sp. CGJS7 TaxID=3109348 RepID=UPI00300BA83E